MSDDPLHQAAALLRQAASALEALDAAPRAPQPPVVPRPPAPGVAQSLAFARHRLQRDFLVGWFQSHGCRLAKRRARWTELTDPRGGQWEVHTQRVMYVAGGVRLGNVDALTLYDLIASGIAPELRPATVIETLRHYERIAGQVVYVPKRR